jgi:hypothetical protein
MALLPFLCSGLIISIISLSNYTWLSLQPPSCILWRHWLFKKHRSSIDLEIGMHSASTSFRALLPSASYSAAGCNGCLVTFFYLGRTKQPLYRLQRAVTPDPASSNFKKRQMVIIICSGLLYPVWIYHGVYLKCK